MPSDKKKIWFPAKRYGWGWGMPCAWQGWVVLAAYVLLACGGAVFLKPDKNLGLWIAYVAILSVIMILICFLKGEKPRWRWGKE